MKKATLSRRSFLKLVGGAAAAGATVGAMPVAAKKVGEHFEPYVVPPEEALPGKATWYATTCRMCAAGCGIMVRTINGRAKKIEGNPSYPLNDGKTCARGQAGLQALYNPDRLRNAVKQNGRESRIFEPLHWETALSSLMDKIEAADPANIIFFGGVMADNLYYVTSRWLEAIGAPPPLQYDLHAALEGRATSAKAAKKLFGTMQQPIYDIANADVIFSFGANFVETWMSPVSYSRAYSKFRGQTGGRGYLVQFEPRMSATAATADQWVPIRPGMDGLVALALGKILGGGSFSGMYHNIDIKEIAHASGIELDTLKKMARILANADHPVVVPGGTPAGHSNGYDSYLAIHSLNLILNQLGREGGVYISPNSPAEALEAAPMPNSFADVEALIERMNGGEVEILFVHGANPVFELPQAAAFKEALANVPYIVSFSSFVDETAVQSDLILPDNTYLESWGYQVASSGGDRPAVASQQPIVERMYDTRSTTEVIMALAKEMGGAAAKALPWESEILFMEDMSGSIYGSSLTPYTTKTGKEFWAAFRQHGGWWANKKLSAEPEAVGFKNSPLPVAAPNFDGRAREYPLFLHPYPSVSLSDGRGANLPWLQEAPDPMTTAAWNTWVEMNPQTAHKYGVHDNDVVKIISPNGEIEARVVVYPGIRPDVVAIPVGQGHEDYGRYAQKRGSNPMDLVGTITDPKTGALAWASARVRIERTGRKEKLARLESLHGHGKEELT